MMVDYTFFALLFSIATSLAPADATVVTLQSSRHQNQAMVWTRHTDGRWTMTLNGRQMGSFERRAHEVLHYTGAQTGQSTPPTEFPIAQLAGTVRRTTARIPLRGRWSSTVLRVERGQGPPRIVDPSGELLRVELILHTR